MALKIYAFHNMKKDDNGTLYLVSQKSYFYEANNAQTRLLREYAVEMGILPVSELYHSKNSTPLPHLPKTMQPNITSTQTSQHKELLKITEKKNSNKVKEHRSDKHNFKDQETSEPPSTMIPVK